MQEDEIIDHPLQKWQQLLWLLIALLAPFFVNFWVEQQFEASKVWLVRSLVWILAGLCLGGWLFRLRSKALPSPIRNLVIALFLVLTLSTLLSTNQYIAFFGSLERANGFLTQMSYILLYLCVATQIEPQSSRQLLHVIIFTAVPICLLGLAQAAGWQPLSILTDARTLITTTLGRANFTGAYLALLLPLTLAAAQLATGRRPRIAYFGLATLELTVIALTQARAAWIAAFVAIAVYLWLRAAPNWSRPVRWLTILSGIAFLAGVLLLLLQRGISYGGSIAARWTIWQAALRLLWPRLWLGYGADTLELHFPSIYPPQLVYYQGRGVVVDRAHNWLLDWSFNYGGVATFIFIVLVAFILRLGWQRLCFSTEQESAEPALQKPLLAACMAALIAHLVGNLFLFEVVATAVLFWLLMAIITAASANWKSNTTRGHSPLWLRKVVFSAVFIVVIWAAWQGNGRPLLADSHNWRGTQNLSQGNPAMALNEYTKAVEYQPHRAAYYGAVALTAAQQGKFEQAEQAQLRAINLRPTDPVLYTQLAAIYSHPEFGHIEPAYAAYEQALALAPNIGLIYQKYADLALRSGDGANAQQQAQQAVDLDATDGVAFGILGWAHLQNGNISAAKNSFTQAVKWQPDSADFHLGLATAYFQEGNIDAAYQEVQDSLILDPTYEPAIRFRAELQNNPIGISLNR